MFNTDKQQECDIPVYPTAGPSFGKKNSIKLDDTIKCNENSPSHKIKTDCSDSGTAFPESGLCSSSEQKVNQLK